MNPLVTLLMDAGLLQFGSFIVNGEDRPFRANLEMLPSYPDVLSQATEELALLMPGSVGDNSAPDEPHVDHLLCTWNSLPLAVTLSLRTGVPLVYSRGSSAEPVHDLVGAYDIGHPAVLFTNVFDDAEPIERLAASGRRVGLDVGLMLTLLDIGVATIDGIRRLALLRLPDVVADLLEAGMLPGGQGRAVLDWIDAQNAAPTPPRQD
jgi:hypothetical protein